MGHEAAVRQRLEANLPAEPLAQEQARFQDRVWVAVEAERQFSELIRTP
jgi:hypothetical protein